MMGLVVTGEKRTQLTHSVWPSASWMVYLHCARVFHSLMVLSRDPDTIWRLSAEKATDMTSLVWSSKRRVVLPAERSQRRRVLSHDPERAKWPSEESTTSETKWPCPCSRFCGMPYWVSSLVSFQTMSDLSLEAERIISGNLGLVPM